MWEGRRVKAQLMCGKELLLGGKQLSAVICTCHCAAAGTGEKRWLPGEIWGGDGFENVGGEVLAGERWINLRCPRYNPFSTQYLGEGGSWCSLGQSVVLRIEREAINGRIGEGIKEGAVKILAH